MRAPLPRAGFWIAVLLLWLAASVVVALGAPTTPAGAAALTEGAPGPGRASVLVIDDAIGPANAAYVVRGIQAAAKAGSPLVILELDTPGGLDSAMRDIIRAILASPVPVVSYVYPPGAHAASAGTYILYASHVAAMAPATNLGAATPVSIGGGDPAPEPTGPETSGGDKSGGSASASSSAPARHGQSAASSASGAAPADTRAAPAHSPDAMERKVVNDAVAYIRGLAELRGRNADWGESAVRGAASLPASAALSQNVIDLIAPDLPALLSQLDGREVRLGPHTVKLATKDLALVANMPDWRTRLLAIITHPTVAYGLMLIGIYGLLFEGYNPGFVLPGVVGAISLLLALFAFEILSVNHAGLALVFLGVGMIVAEFFLPTYGSLGVGGLIAFVVGSIMLFNNDVPGMSIGRPLIGGIAAGGGLVILAMVYQAARSRMRPVVTGVQGMLGDAAEAVESFTGQGRVRYRGEHWNAVSDLALSAGQKARIVKVEGLTLYVEPL